MFFSIIICVVVLNNKNEVIYKLDDEIKLYEGQNVKVDNLSVSLISISDSTCPMDTQCVWQGEYSYELLIGEDKIFLGTVSSRQYEYLNYNITLLDDTSKEYVLFKINKVK